MRFEQISVTAFTSCWRRPKFFAFGSLLLRAIDISSKMRIGVYDCIYVALAEQEGCELATADDKLFNTLHKDFPFIISLASLP
jgi:predicted nucleic acid-binding protein